MALWSYEVSVIFHLLGAHTNSIESAWRWAKDYLKRSCKVRSDDILHRELTSYTWRKWYGTDNQGGCFGQIIADIAAICPPE